MTTERTPGALGSNDQLGQTEPKHKDLGDLIDELVDASVSLELAQRPQSIQLGSFRVERIEDELRERLEEVRLMKMAIDNLEARICMERQQQRDACASAAWIHYMDVCKARGLAPSEHEHWNAARAVRNAGIDTDPMPCGHADISDSDTGPNVGAKRLP